MAKLLGSPRSGSTVLNYRNYLIIRGLVADEGMMKYIYIYIYIYILSRGLPLREEK